MEQQAVDGFQRHVLAGPRPEQVGAVELPRRVDYHPSPADWRDEVLYFLLPDRFSDGGEDARPLLDRANPAAHRPPPWRWDRWAQSGGDRWQGGTINGIRSKLGYLRRLNVTTLWVAPVFRQRDHLNTYHGYGIQDFLDVDPRFGSRADLVALVAEAHAAGLRVILDVIYNHSGSNWVYPAGTPGGAERPDYTGGRYPFGAWRSAGGGETAAIGGPGDGVWPRELQDPDRYTRAGRGNLGAGDIDDPNAEARRSDFEDLRDFRLEAPGLLADLARCYKYWIALTDCDGFRIDTLKHVSLEEARNFCGSIKEFAANLGKADFFLVGEVAGGDYNEDRYLDVLARNLNATLDIGEMRPALTAVAKGLTHPSDYFRGFDPGRAVMGSHRMLGNRHVSILDDHDHVFGQKLRFSAEAASDRQVVAGVALQYLALGIPCVYYGTEQALSGGPEPAERHWLPGWGVSDRYLREALFGPAHPRADGAAGLTQVDPNLPGFGLFGTAGAHSFDEGHPAYRRIARLGEVRRRYPVLRYGRQYPRPISFLGRPFDVYGGGELVAWSRILDDEEALCVVNVHGAESRGADVLVDAGLNPPGSSLTVVLATAAVDGGAGPAEGATLPVRHTLDGTAYVQVRELPPSEVLVLLNR